MGLEQYEILKSLAEKGGMSDIFLGLDKQTNEHVVIKFMRSPEDTSDNLSLLAHFNQEVPLALSMSHPHVLQAISSGEAKHNGRVSPFLVYPYISDGSLQKLITNHAPWEHWTLPQLVDVIVQAAEGLYYLHTLTPSIVHLDVKPANFLLRNTREQGSDRIVHIWLSDFGISRWQREPTYRTQPMNIIGTIQYMAPEYMEEGAIRVESDQYSLALVTRYLFTGYRPTVDKKGINTPLSELNPALIQSKEIDEVVLKALSEDPTQRFANVREFASNLQAAVIRQINPEKFYLLPATPEPRLPEFPLRPLLSKEAPAQPSMLSWAPDGTLLSCTFYGQESPWLLRMDENIEIPQTLPPSHLTCWSPNGQFLAISVQDKSHKISSIYLWDKEKPAEQPVVLCVHNTAAIDGLDWSSQGQLAVWVEARILLYDLRMQTTLSHFPSIPPAFASEQPLFNGSLGTLCWSPDGRLLAAGANDGSLLCWHRGFKRPFFQIPACGARIYSLAWSSDSRRLAIAFQDKRVELWNMHAHSQVRRERSWEISSIPQMLSFSPQEEVLTIATTRNLLFARFSEDTPFAQYPGQMLVAWSPDGQHLATLDAKNDMTIVILER